MGKAEGFVNLEADVLDILTSTWLNQAKTANDRAIISVDDLISMRGIKPKEGGQGRRGGYNPNQRRAHLTAAAVIFDLWITISCQTAVDIGAGKRSKRRVFQSRPFVVTDRLGDLRLYDDYVDVRAFTYLPGEIFAALLTGSRPSVLLSARALQYNVRTQVWLKRLTRYYSFLWGGWAIGRDYHEPLRISTIFRDGLRSEIDTRWLARMKDRFVECHRTLQLDGVIACWRFERQEGPWDEWTIVIEPPDEIRKAYEESPQAVPSFELSRFSSPSRDQGWGARIRARRESLGLTQRRLAEQLGISQSTLNRAESGRGSIPEALRNWVKAS